MRIYRLQRKRFEYVTERCRKLSYVISYSYTEHEDMSKRIHLIGITAVISDTKCLNIVSGDKDLLTVEKYEDIRIMTVAEFLDLA